MPRYGCQIIAAPGRGCSKPGISENLDFCFVIFGCGFLYVYIVLPSGLSLKNLKLRKLKHKLMANIFYKENGYIGELLILA